MDSATNMNIAWYMCGKNSAFYSYMSQRTYLVQQQQLCWCFCDFATTCGRVPPLCLISMAETLKLPLDLQVAGLFPIWDIFLKGLFFCHHFSCLVGNLRMDCMDQWKDGCIDLTKGSIHLHGGRGLGQDSSFASRMDGWVACQSKGATKKT